MKMCLTVVLTVFIRTLALACSCEGHTSVSAAYHGSDVVFSGEVVRLTYVTTSESIKPSALDSIKINMDPESRTKEMLEMDLLIKVELKLNRCFKGNSLQDTVTIYTTRTGASCGYRGFAVGRQYIVYASNTSYLYGFFLRQPCENIGREGTYWTNQCMRTQEYTYAETVELEKCMNGE
jgi:hypothetical protein